MTKLISFLMAASSAFVAYSQNPEEWQSLEFQNKEDYRTHESKILECANFVLRVPAEMGDPARKSAMGAISRWMSGTPDYQFGLDESIMKLTEKNDIILSIYMAAMAKFVLENKDKADDENVVKLNSFSMLLDYCADVNNKVHMTKELKKAMRAKDSGKLKKYLGT